MLGFQVASQGEGAGPKGWARRWGLAASGLALALVMLAMHAHHFDFINDDAFISFRYADTLVRHGELTYNAGERVEGYTNFLWTMVIAGVLALGGDPVPWSKALGVLCSAGTLAVVFGFAVGWRRRLDPLASMAGAALAPLALAMSSSFAAWSEGGLETALFTLLVTVGVLRYVVERQAPEDAALPPWSGAVLGLAAMTRPEGVLVMGLLGLHRLGWLWAVERRALPPREAWLWGVGFLAVFAPYWIWRYAYYGFPFPNTYYAKGDAPLWGAGWRYVGSFVTACHVWVVVPLLAIPWRRAGSGALVSAVAAVALPYMVYVARVGGDFMALHRFLVPLLPLLLLVAQEGAVNVVGLARAAWARAEGAAPGWRFEARVAGVGLVMALALGAHSARATEAALEVGSSDGVDSIGWLKQFVVQTTAIGVHLRDTYPPETSLATTAAGVIPYYSRMRTLDLLALNDVYTAHNVPAHASRPGHAKAAPEPYVLRWAPTLLIWHPRMSAHPPSPRRGEPAYWKTRGYAFKSAKVPGLEPPYWSYFERIAP